MILSYLAYNESVDCYDSLAIYRQRIDALMM
jgi:hypothetical protein